MLTAYLKCMFDVDCLIDVIQLECLFVVRYNKITHPIYCY